MTEFIISSSDLVESIEGDCGLNISLEQMDIMNTLIVSALKKQDIESRDAEKKGIPTIVRPTALEFAFITHMDYRYDGDNETYIEKSSSLLNDDIVEFLKDKNSLVCDVDWTYDEEDDHYIEREIKINGVVVCQFQSDVNADFHDELRKITTIPLNRVGNVWEVDRDKIDLNAEGGVNEIFYFSFEINEVDV